MELVQGKHLDSACFQFILSDELTFKLNPIYLEGRKQAVEVSDWTDQ